MKHPIKIALLVSLFFIFAGAYVYGAVPECDPDEAICNFIQSETFSELITKIAKLITIASMPLVVLFLILSGLLFVTAGGNEEQVSKARKIFWWTVIGVAIIVGSWAIASAIDKFGKSLGEGNGGNRNGNGDFVLNSRIEIKPDKVVIFQGNPEETFSVFYIE